MAGNTGASIQENQTFTTGVVTIAVGVLNPANSAQSVWDAGVGMTYASMTTVVTGSPTSFTILLEGTYDGLNWTTLATTTNVSGETQYATGLIPFTNLRARCTAVSGGTSPTVNVFATASQYPITNTGGGASPATTVNQGTSNTSLATGWRVAEGSVVAGTHFTAQAATNTGTVVDMGASCQSVTWQVVASAGTTAGAVTFLGSLDNTTFSPLTTAVLLGGTSGNSMTGGILSFTAAGNALVNLGSNLSAIRYFRADVTTTFTGGTATAKVQAF